MIKKLSEKLSIETRKLVKIVFMVSIMLTVCVARAAEEILPPEELTALGTNILQNPDFEEWSNSLPNNWINRNINTIACEGQEVKYGSYSLKETGEAANYHYCFDQHIPLGSYAGKTIIFGVWAKASSNAGPVSVSIMDWVGTDHKYNTSPEHPKDGNWHFMSVRRTIRADATGEIWFRLNQYTYTPPADIYFDGAVAVEVP